MNIVYIYQWDDGSSGYSTAPPTIGDLICIDNGVLTIFAAQFSGEVVNIVPHFDGLEITGFKQEPMQKTHQRSMDGQVYTLLI